MIASDLYERREATTLEQYHPNATLRALTGLHRIVRVA
jgi:hypothetical protein